MTNQQLETFAPVSGGVSAGATAAAVQWVGSTYHWPFNGSITPSSEVWINTESWPMGAAVGGRVVYSTDHGATWHSVNMSKNGTADNNDRWHVNLGAFPSGTTIRYAVEVTSSSRWDNNSGQDYHATVNTADGEIGSDSLNWNGSIASLSVSNLNSDARGYTLNSNAVRRPDSIGNPRPYSETSGKPIVRTGNNLFDSLFSLAYYEMTNTLSVNEISDDAYNGGNPITCPEGGCFKTGVKWPYVWTRDSAYSVALSLAQFDPVRAMNTLNFKVSDRRGNPGKPEIIQDTGSGGSWPVSSDRVVWARAAWELLKYLDDGTRTRFRDAAYNAIVNTVENDRVALYDSQDDLYRGEQSFLDWREQTYPSWTAYSVVHIGMSKTLSTNVNHCRTLDVAARLAEEKGQMAERDKYRGWADALKTAIDEQLWLASTGLYSTMKTTELDPSAIRRYDLLGEALAIIDGIADSAKAALILQKYPHTVAGAPVSCPQIRDTKIYHNRSIWLFASAYWMKAAALAKNDQVVNHNLKSLLRGAALNLSHMENFEFIGLSAWVNDPDNKDDDAEKGHGPDIDSEAQLWSVAGYMSAVLDLIFGRQATQTGIRFQPFVTHYMRNTLFPAAASIKLHNLPYKGKLLNVELLLPAKEASDSGYYNMSSVTLNGATVANDTYFTATDLAATDQIQIQLVDANAPTSSLTVVIDTGDYKRFWAPREPNNVSVTLNSGLLTVSFDTNGESGVTYNIYRNGVEVASGLTSTRWTDPHSGNWATTTLGYSVEQKYVGSYLVDNYSHHSDPMCYWADGTITEITIDSGLHSLDGTSTAPDHGRLHFNNWGYPNQVLEATYTPGVTARYAIQTVYGNAFNGVGTGITTCVKIIEVANSSNEVVASAVVIMPHLRDWDTWGYSSFAEVSLLKAGVTYKIRVKDFYNMSYLASNAKYRDKGGVDGPVNRANIYSLKILRREIVGR